MKKTIDIWAVIVALLAALGISYVICILGDLLFGWTMYQVWEPLLPGFTWPLTVGGFLLGLVWLVAYSVFGGLIIALPYNAVARQKA